jgi:hypothetical protein
MTDTPVDISPEAVELLAKDLDNADPWEHFGGWEQAAMLRALRSALTASERLLRDVGTGGRFSLSAVNSDEADAWYVERDSILAKGEAK